MENAIVTVNGKAVVYDVDLAEWLKIDLQELRIFIRMNSAIIPPSFVFRLDDHEWSGPGRVGAGRSPRRPVRPVFVFTIHGVILINASLGQTANEAINPQIVRLLSILKKRFTGH